MAKKSTTERIKVMIMGLVNEVDRIEADLGRIEDELGLPRSASTDPWTERLRRIEEAVAARGERQPR
jgi:hypothetical protein